MRIARAIGTVTLSRAHETLPRDRLRLVVPLSLDDLQADTTNRSDVIVTVDQLGAGDGQRIAVSEGPEAAQPYRPEIKPIDAYNAAILDQIRIPSDKTRD